MLGTKDDALTSEQAYFRKVTNACTYSHKELVGAMLWMLLAAIAAAACFAPLPVPVVLAAAFAWAVIRKPIRVLYMAAMPLTLAIRTAEFLDTKTHFPQHTLFETAEIRDEVNAYVKNNYIAPMYQQFAGENAYIGSGRTPDGSLWRIKLVKMMARVSADAQQHLPHLVRALRAVETQVVSCAISKLEPGVKIPMHVGYYKGILRYMVAIAVPDHREGVWLNVNGHIKHWTQGEGFLWDDTYPHAVYNTTQQTRVLLCMDIARTRMAWPLLALNRIMTWVTAATGIVDAEMLKTEKVVPITEQEDRNTTSLFASTAQK